MTCQHCQTWILDHDHRCHRCGRRVRNTPARISPSTYPIAAAATARAYDLETEDEIDAFSPASGQEAQAPQAQQSLFSQPLNGPRVIRFDELTTAAERESIRARAADLARPAPLRSGKVELRRARGQKRRPDGSGQRPLEFGVREEVPSQPQSSIICDAPVAPPVLRLQAAALDSLTVTAGCAVCLAIFYYIGGRVALNNRDLPFLLAALLTVPFFYRLLWTCVGRDTIGMRQMGLQLVDFDGNPPSKERRYYRLFGGILSLLAAGLGLLWIFVDQDGLTWHDHISSTFPTLTAEN